jgi:glycosyltransferase involved in cell wall biosynthesis
LGKQKELSRLEFNGDKMRKIIVRGPALSRSGYGEHTRFLLRALKSREDVFDIFILNVNWGQTGWIWEDDEERRWIDSVLHKTQQYVDSGGQFDISVQVTIPNEWERIAPINIGVTAGIETTKVSPQWVEKSMVVEKIITISEHSKQVYENTSYEAQDGATGEIIKDFRCTTPIEIVHYPVRDFEVVDLDLDLDYDFNFLTVAQISTRKNMANTIRWFVEEFKDDEVGLVAKCNIKCDSTQDRIETEKLMKSMLEEYEDRKCKVYLIHGHMTDDKMHSLYKHPKIKAYAGITHGEGFGLPIFEAAYNELPVVAPDWSGHVDFLYAPVKNKKTGKVKPKAHFAKVKYTLQPVQPDNVWDGVIQADSMWCYPEEKSYKSRLREVYKEHQRFKGQAKRLNKWIRDNFSKEQQYKKFVDAICPPQDLEVADLESWFNELESEIVEHD